MAFSSGAARTSVCLRPSTRSGGLAARAGEPVATSPASE